MLNELLKGRSCYTDDTSHARVPYNLEHLKKIFKKNIRPLPLLPRLDGEARGALQNFATVIEKSEREVEESLCSGTVTIRPYWDPYLAHE